MTRQESNIEILSILEKYIMENPDLRFGQILQNLNINRWSDYAKEKFNSPFPNDGNYDLKDTFNEESAVTLRLIKNV